MEHLREVAFGKRTKESSVFYSSNLAFDGNFDTISSTQFEEMPYLEVDLGKEYQKFSTGKIVVVSRKRLHDLDITIGPSHNQMSLCAHYKGPGRNGEHLAFKCHHTNKYARYVKLTIKGKNFLQVGEVKEYAVVDLK
ncbi:Hypothetical predicted protein [Mytilus galloprovincialis]|uniref:F5/8 type C domain-containing protein n=1 Tax=Mytilus galloprovincialis TaxID=29158 RepID=A0A8B6GEZ0_MYTGA|nr:Hypothetical predicted protein [Mytilus galloprovincialis]